MMKNFREPLNGLTHFVGIMMAIGVLIALLNRADHSDTLRHTISFCIFGVAMILLYTTSTLYHWLPASGRRLALLRTLDHIMIFVFIAASYTPVCVLLLPDTWGWSILTAVWGITIAGLFLKIFWLEAPRLLYTAIYILMGWVIVIGIWPLSRAMPAMGLTWLATGGAAYTVGAIIYAFKRPDPWPGLLGFHEIFHIFVLLGSLAHFWMLYRYV
jgi:hemolysin III